MKQPKQVKVYAPASIGNIGAGFDVLGAAIMEPGDIVIAKRVKRYGLKFSLHHSSESVPKTPANVASHVASLLIEMAQPQFGIDLILYKNMPVGSGLGSSAASAAAAAVAVNALLPKPLKKMELLPFVVEGERLASGSAHADNAAPSLLGGICLIRSYNPLEAIKLPIENNLYWIVVHPHTVIETKSARKVLPTSIPLNALSSQLGNIGGLITGLITGDTILAGKSMRDCIAEPARSLLIPAFQEVNHAAMQAGALGFSISGSGPSVFAVSNSLSSARRIAECMKAAFANSANLDCDVFISRINQQGAKIIG